MERLLVWEGGPGYEAGYEIARVTLDGGSLDARGEMIRRDPEPVAVHYELETVEGYVTSRLTVTAWGDGWERALDLRRTDRGWSANGDELEALDEVLDCDLGFCCVTNSMPVLRHDLSRSPGARAFLMAWVAVPELEVHRSEQRYEHLRPGLVRFSSGTFSADISFDGDGLVFDYPGLARRLG